MICDNCLKEVVCKFTELCRKAEQAAKIDTKSEYSPLRINIICDQYDGKLTSTQFQNRTYRATTTGDPNPVFAVTTSSIMCDPVSVNRRDYYDEDDLK